MDLIISDIDFIKISLNIQYCFTVSVQNRRDNEAYSNRKIHKLLEMSPERSDVDSDSESGPAPVESDLGDSGTDSSAAKPCDDPDIKPYIPPDTPPFTGNVNILKCHCIVNKMDVFNYLYNYYIKTKRCQNLNHK